MENLVTYNLKSSMPRVEVHIFNVDATQYKSFIRALDSKLTDEKEKLLYLEQYTSVIVRVCSQMATSAGYKEIR